ncbi:MAG: hypothetical protein M3Y85_01530 [Bacteroidota bacterium]|nr:hypothetical protein [Bacteroidota bacterium]
MFNVVMNVQELFFLFLSLEERKRTNQRLQQTFNGDLLLVTTIIFF